MCSMSYQLEVLTGNDKILLLYILKGHDVILLPNIIEWLDLCNIKYKGSNFNITINIIGDLFIL